MKLWIALGVILVVLFWGVSSYNGLVPLDENVKAKWGQVENLYQRRSDLVPNLVETVKGVAGFEKSTFTDVAEARAKVGQIKITAESLTPEALAGFQQAQAGLSGALSRLMAVAEAYPELKSNQNFLDLQKQLEGTENRIAVGRKDFNEAVQTYNPEVRRFPKVMIAGLLGFKEKPYFKSEEGSEKAPKISF